ncbi:unnamed protein product [Malus baccata var. baccata]
MGGIMVLLLLIITLHVNLGHGDANMTMRCTDKEREALLAFKEGLIISKYDRVRFSSWGTEAAKQDCCRWEGVSCDKQTGNVVQLDLGDHYYLQGTMISPKLIELKHLKYLNLSGIDFGGSQVPYFIGSLTNLRYLDLSFCSFGGKFPIQVGNLTNLQHLDLGYNDFSGNVENLNWLPRLSSLTDLDLSHNNLSNVFYWPEAVNKLPKLTTLILQNCSLPSPPVRSTLSNINSSIFLWMSNYSTSLVDLYLHSNHLTGSIPDVFGNMSSLAHQQFENPISESHFSKLSRLRELDLSSNSLVLNFQSNWTPPFQLDYIHLGSCKMGPYFPKWLQSQNEYSFLNISNAGIVDILPSWFWGTTLYVTSIILSHNQIGEMFTNLTVDFVNYPEVHLRSNQIEGQIPATLSHASYLDLSNNNISGYAFNQLTGSIPKWLGASFQKLVILMLSSNHFNGSLPPQLCDLIYIQILDVSVNIISGGIPNCLKKLTTLAQKGNSILTVKHFYKRNDNQISLLDNYVDDEIFTWKGSMQVYRNTLGLVRSIDFSSNRLTGEIPSEISHLVGLVSLNLSRNQLTGQITPDIGKLESLDSLDLSRNHIDGRIPTSLARISHLGVLDLSHNNLIGKIPTGTQLQSFDPSVYAGNPQLCGPPFKSRVISKKRVQIMLVRYGFYISMGLGFFVGFWGVCGSLIFIREWRHLLHLSSTAWLPYLHKLSSVRCCLIPVITRLQKCTRNMFSLFVTRKFCRALLWQD